MMSCAKDLMQVTNELRLRDIVITSLATCGSSGAALIDIYRAAGLKFINKNGGIGQQINTLIEEVSFKDGLLYMLHPRYFDEVNASQLTFEQRDNLFWNEKVFPRMWKMVQKPK